MGDSACWLHLVCPACGRVVEERSGDHGACPHSGAVEDPSVIRGEDADAAAGTQTPPDSDQE